MVEADLSPGREETALRRWGEQIVLAVRDLEISEEEILADLLYTNRWNPGGVTTSRGLRAER